MRDDSVSITASLLVREEGSNATGYVVTMTGAPTEVATLTIHVDIVSESWREEFRLLCQHLMEELLSGQGAKPNWVSPRAPARQAG